MHAHAHKYTHTTQIRSRCCSWLSVGPEHHFPGRLSSGAADGDVHVDSVCQRSSQTTARLLRVVCVCTHGVSLTDWENMCVHDHFNSLTLIDCVCTYANSWTLCEQHDMMTSRFGLQCSDSEHSAIIFCMQEQQCVAMTTSCTQAHTRTCRLMNTMTLSQIMSSYVYGPIDYDSWTLIVMTLTLPVGTAMIWAQCWPFHAGAALCSEDNKLHMTSTDTYTRSTISCRSYALAHACTHTHTHTHRTCTRTSEQRNVRWLHLLMTSRFDNACGLQFS